MAKQVKILEAKVGKTRIPGALMGGDRYICTERLMAAAASDMTKEEKRSLTKKLVTESGTYGGAFRAKMGGFDRWFMTRALIASCLDGECRTYRSATYARFNAHIRTRIRILLDMLALANKLCGGRKFHRVEGVLVFDIDRTESPGCTEQYIDDVIQLAGNILDEDVPGQSAGDDPGQPDAAGAAGPDDGGEAEQESGPCGNGYTPDRILSLVNGPVKLPDETVLKLNDRLCALAVILNIGMDQPGHASSLMAVRAVLLQPNRTVQYSEWVSLFGVRPDGTWHGPESETTFTERTWRCAASCAGVWDVTASGPVPAMRAGDLLMNIMTRP